MKSYFKSTLFSLFIFCQVSCGFEFDGDKVRFNREEIEQIDLLNDALRNFHDKNLKRVPDSVKSEMMQVAYEDFNNLSTQSMDWAQQNLVIDIDMDLSKAFKAVLKWSELNGDDVSSIISETFWEHLHNKDFQLLVKMAYHIKNLRESTSPDIRFSPNGHGEIGWYWKLLSQRRTGILHVGIDLKKRTFICYESDLGLYFPEGDTMERIYTEIVQDSNKAGIHLGKGLKQQKSMND